MNADTLCNEDPCECPFPQEQELCPLPGEDGREPMDALFADPHADPDPDPLPPAKEEGDSIKELRASLDALREELRENARALSRVEKDYGEFHALFPNVSVESVPDGVWRAVEKGSSLCAAYALAERRRAMTEERARLAAQENRRRSAGALRTTPPSEYTPEEVRAMSPEQVRANLSAIMRSMQKWH